MSCSINFKTPLYELYHLINHLRSNIYVLKVVGASQLCFGLIGAYNLRGEITRYHTKKLKSIDVLPKWQQTMIKLTPILGNLSLILTSLVSYPATKFYSWSAQKLLQPEQYLRYFGENGSIPTKKIGFIIRLGAFIIGLPSSIKFSYQTIIRAKEYFFDKKIEHPKKHHTRRLDLYLAVNTLTTTIG